MGEKQLVQLFGVYGFLLWSFLKTHPITTFLFTVIFMFFPQDPVLNDLYAVFRGYWPVKKSESTALAKEQDGYENTLPETDVATPDADLEDTEHHDDEPDDTQLAEALGVPTSCVSKMSPSKANVELESGVDGVPLSEQEQRAARILELKFPDNVSHISFLFS